MTLMLACGASPRGEDGLDPGDVTAGFTTSATSGPGSGTSGVTGADPDPGGSSGAGSTGSGDGDGIKFDTPDGNTGAGDGGPAMGCQKVDFLFVIDNSGSMYDEQQNLANSFPKFMEAIEGTLMAQDFHVMAIDSDAWWETGGLAGASISCSPAPSCCWGICGPGSTCNGQPCPPPPDPPEPCDAVLGAGRTIDADLNACPLDGGKRYMFDGQADLSGTFACVANAGTDGDGNEKPMEAMMESVSPALNGAGGCNEGFLRDDAILVVTFITDEEDKAGKSAGDPAAWKQALVDAKAGNEEAVVVIGILGDKDLPNPVCNGNEAAPRLRAFVDSFPNGVYDSVCLPDYSPVFVDAVSVIDTACDGFVPPG